MVTQQSGTSARLQAISAATAEVVWASGLEGTVLRSTDGGMHWRHIRVPGASALQFRDVHAVNDDQAFLLSAGKGNDSRIYKTMDGGTTWTQQFIMTEPEGFLDCFDFWDAEHGIAYGDSVASQLYLLQTEDGGTTWSRVPASALPKAGQGEGGFAASGSCVHVEEGGRGWVATGAGGNARVLRTEDKGAHWEAAETPILKGESAGITSVVRIGDAILALGGDIAAPDSDSGIRVSRSDDNGRTWLAQSSPPFPGPVYGAAVGGSRDRPLVVAVGPKGAALSRDHGRHWISLSDDAYWSVTFGSPTRFWLVGPEGAIMRVED